MATSPVRVVTSLASRVAIVRAITTTITRRVATSLVRVAITAKVATTAKVAITVRVVTTVSRVAMVSVPDTIPTLSIA